MTQSVSTFPTSLDSFDDPSNGDALGGAGNLVDHVEHTKWIVDAVEKIEALIGITGSGVTSSLEYRITNHTHSAGGSVTEEKKLGLPSSQGVAATVARSDHTHGTPSIVNVFGVYGID